MIEITGLWINTSKKGQQYMVGYMGGAQVLIFKNQHKKEDKHPDYNMYIAEKSKSTDTAEIDTDDEVAF